MKYITVWKEGNGNKVIEWLLSDNVCTYEEIISLVQNKPQDDFHPEEIDEANSLYVSYSDAANAFEIVLCYVQQRSDEETNWCHIHETLMKYCFNIHMALSGKSNKFLHHRESLKVCIKQFIKNFRYVNSVFSLPP